VSELIGIAGGDDIFAELAAHKSVPDRIVSADAVIQAAPNLMWCGKIGAAGDD